MICVSFLLFEWRWGFAKKSETFEFGPWVVVMTPKTRGLYHRAIMFLNLLPGLENDFAEEIVCWRVDGLLADTGDWELGEDGLTALRLVGMRTTIQFPKLRRYGSAVSRSDRIKRADPRPCSACPCCLSWRWGLFLCFSVIDKQPKSIVESTCKLFSYSL